MKRDILNLNFLCAVKEKIPNKTKLANKLVDILQIEKEAVYRRLRAEVPFTFAEVALIASELGISLDKTIGINSDNSRPFSLILQDLDTPSETDFIMLNNFIGFLEIIKRDPNSEINECWNTLPFPLSYTFENITRFYLFRWRYHFKNNVEVKRFSDIHISNSILGFQQKHLEEYKNIHQTNLILDSSIFYKLVLDIQYFASIRLLTETDVLLIKEDLLKFIDYLNHLSVTGIFEESGNRINIYISDINIDTNYSCLETRSYTLCMIRTLVLNAAATPDTLTFKHLKGWINSLKRLSTLISVSGEIYRINYINKQNEIINSL